jgi:hypothetical protein
MSPEPTGVHGLLKQRKLFTHKYNKDRENTKKMHKKTFFAGFWVTFHPRQSSENHALKQRKRIFVK